MTSASTPVNSVDRQFVVKSPGFDVSGFNSTPRCQARIRLATNEQILFDLIYGSEINAKGYEHQYKCVYAQVLNRPELIKEIFALLKFHREQKEHNPHFPGFDALEKFESVLIEFGKKYPARKHEIVDTFIRINTNEIFDHHRLKRILRAILECDYCPPYYVKTLVELLGVVDSSCEIFKYIARSLAHAGPAGVAELRKKMIQFPKLNWSWAFLELSLIFDDFQTRFEDLIPVALEQVLCDGLSWGSSRRSISASLFGAQIQEALFERWERAKSVRNEYEASHVRDGVAVSLAAIGGIPKLIQDFGDTPIRILAIFGTIKYLLNRRLDAEPTCPFWKRISYVPNLNYEFDWILEMAEGEDLMIQRHALDLLCSFVAHVNCTEEQKFRVAKLITSLPKTGIPVDRQLRLLVVLKILNPWMDKFEDRSKLQTSNDETFIGFKKLVEVIQISHSLRDNYLQLVNPQARKEQAFEPWIRFNCDARYRKMPSAEIYEKLKSRQFGNRIFLGIEGDLVFDYLIEMYDETIQRDMEIAKQIIQY